MGAPRLLSHAVVLATLAAPLAAQATVASSMYVSEIHPWGWYRYDEYTGPALYKAHQWPMDWATTHNSAAYINPRLGRQGGYALSDIDPAMATTDEYTPVHRKDIHFTDVYTEYYDTLAVTSPTSEAGTAVILRMTLQLDGRLRNGQLHSDPGKTLSYAGAFAEFTVKDTATGATHATFEADANATKETREASQFHEARYWVEHESDWSVRDGHGVWLDGDEYERIVERDYFISDSSLQDVVDVYRFDTGEVEVLIHTYVGATLQLYSYLQVMAESDVVTQANGSERPSPWAEADFRNTFGANFTVVASEGTPEGVTLLYGSSLVPEPASLSLLAMGALVMLRRRR